jgi:hypothetical protein
MEVICTGNPLEIIAEFPERVGETLDVTCAVVEEVQTHVGGGEQARASESLILAVRAETVP